MPNDIFLNPPYALVEKIAIAITSANVMGSREQALAVLAAVAPFVKEAGNI